MCRSTDYRILIDRDRLKIRSFSIHFLGIQPDPSRPLPDFLTLLYLPRLSEHSLLIEGSEIRPDSPAFITLHRAVSPGSNLYASRDRIVAGEGLRFDVYVREDRILKGVFRKKEDEDDDDWRLECKCTMETEAVKEGTVAEVCVVAEEGGGVAAMMSERVEMGVRRRKRKELKFGELEEIPEEREIEEGEDECDERSDGGDCCCCCGGDGMGIDGGDLTEQEMKKMMMMEFNTENARWAVDVGIGIMCFGVGFLVSTASARSLRRMRKLL